MVTALAFTAFYVAIVKLCQTGSVQEGVRAGVHSFEEGVEDAAGFVRETIDDFKIALYLRLSELAVSQKEVCPDVGSEVTGLGWVQAGLFGLYLEYGLISPQGMPLDSDLLARRVAELGRDRRFLEAFSRIAIPLGQAVSETLSVSRGFVQESWRRIRRCMESNPDSAPIFLHSGPGHGLQAVISGVTFLIASGRSLKSFLEGHPNRDDLKAALAFGVIFTVTGTASHFAWKFHLRHCLEGERTRWESLGEIRMLAGIYGLTGLLVLQPYLTWLHVRQAYQYIAQPDATRTER
ncbi:MAG: hypothetical protein V1495_00245 [Pseudomonadota bacterium]